MLRAIQKYYFPDSSEASQLWVKLYTFAMVRDRAQKFAAMGSAGKRLAPRVTTPQVVSDALLAGSVELVADALKNVTARNAEEKCHSRHAKFFREKELKQVSPAPVLDSARCRGCLLGSGSGSADCHERLTPSNCLVLFVSCRAPSEVCGVDSIRVRWRRCHTT